MNIGQKKGVLSSSIRLWDRCNALASALALYMLSFSLSCCYWRVRHWWHRRWHRHQRRRRQLQCRRQRQCRHQCQRQRRHRRWHENPNNPRRANIGVVLDRRLIPYLYLMPILYSTFPMSVFDFASIYLALLLFCWERAMMKLLENLGKSGRMRPKRKQ